MVALSITISAVLALVLGLLILVFPKMLRWAIGIYLLAFGLIQLLTQYVQFSPY